MRILLFGKNGQVGWELQRSLSPLGELIALSSDSTECCGDLSNLEGLARTVRDLAPDVIVNAAAYTSVDKAETELQLANTINALAVGVLAREAKQCGAWLIHYSTDYVFDGSGEKPWQEADGPNPLSAYGKTKVAGEIAIKESGCNHLIFRTSWVYAARGTNFVKTMIRLAQERQQLNVVNDQFGAPTGAELLADVTAHCIRQVMQRPELGGLYHLAASGVTTWYAYALFVIEFARRSGTSIRVEPEMIKPVPTSVFPLLAARPRNSRLDSTRLQNVFNLRLPEWRTGVARTLVEITEKKNE